MEIDWNVIHTGGLTISHYAFSDVNKLKEGIRTSGTADFVVRHATTTSLDIEVSSPGAPAHTFAVAYVPKGAEKYKFHTQRIRSVFTGATTERRRFKLTKTQGLPELKDYLTLVLRDLIPDMEKVTVNLTLHKMPEFQE